MLLASFLVVGSSAFLGIFEIFAAESVSVSITEFPIPTSSSYALGITKGPDGNMWFTEYLGNKIGRITPSGSIVEFAVPTSMAYPNMLATGPDGNIWFTEARGYDLGKIGKITPNGEITEFPIPTMGSAPGGIVAGHDNKLWFTEFLGNKIGNIDSSGIISEYSVPTPGSRPYGIAKGPDSNIWFTEHFGNKIGRITSDGSIVEYMIPTNDSHPAEIVAGPDGNLWFTEATGNKIGRITPSGLITEFPLSANSAPYGITVGPDGNIWFTESWYEGTTGNKIGKITMSGEITEYPIPTEGSRPLNIATGADGNIWFVEEEGNKIGRVNLSTASPSSFTCGTSTVQDVDGNTYGTTDVNGQCWMTENMRAGTMVTGATTQTDNGTIEKYCYNNDPANCTTDGGLYQWDEAMQYSTTEGARGICPVGWHVPTDAEQYALESYLKNPGATCNADRTNGASTWDCDGAGTKMKSGTPPGLNFPLNGYRNTDGTFNARTTTPSADIWSSSKIGTSAWNHSLYSAATVGRGTSSKTFGLTVRCLRDSSVPEPTNHAPEIKLNGDATMTLNVGDMFNDPGATASDPEDGDITSKITVTGSVDTSKTGTYTITYNVKDSKDLAADPVTRMVVVQGQSLQQCSAKVDKDDNKLPYICYDGGPIKYLNIGDDFSVEKDVRYFTALGNPLELTGYMSQRDYRVNVFPREFFDINSPGTYHITYRIFEGASFIVLLDRTIIVSSGVNEHVPEVNIKSWTNEHLFPFGIHFYVDYKDLDNDRPVSLKLFVNDVEQSLELFDSNDVNSSTYNDSDYTNSETYISNLSIPGPGTYTYYVKASDGLHDVQTEPKTIEMKDYECRDGIDNDGDGDTDNNEAACHSDGNPKNSETYNPFINSELFADEQTPTYPGYDVAAISAIKKCQADRKKNYVVLTHGWNSNIDVWANAMGDRIGSMVDRNNWCIVTWDWRNDAEGLPWDAYAKAENQGMKLGKILAGSTPEKVHFLAHSAGSNLIQHALDTMNDSLKENGKNRPKTQMTFFDAFAPYGSDKDYGSGSSYAEQYVDTRTLGPKSCIDSSMPSLISDYFDSTDTRLNNVINFDVTGIDPVKNPTGSCEDILIHFHQWPIRWYHDRTIRNRLVPGFGNSFESGVVQLPGPLKNWWCTVKAGSSITDCEAAKSVGRGYYQFSDVVVNWKNEPFNLTRESVADISVEQSQTGAHSVDENSFEQITGSPVWTKVYFTTDAPVNMLAFDYTFLSDDDAAGVFNIFVDGNLLMSRDEQLLEKGRSDVVERQLFDALEPGRHSIVFRLDPFSDVKSRVRVSNIKTGFKETKEVPYAGANYRYRADFEKLISTDGQDGLTLQIDESGDGIFGHEMQVSSNFSDTTAPTTTATIAGTLGNNGWYKDTTTVKLSATDNDGGVGVRETKYSLDNGATWKVYADPFTISDEGAHTVQYYSEDWFGNVEETKTAEIKIDKTVPEVAITNPTNNANLYGPVDIKGSVTDTNPDHYELTILDSSGAVVSGPGAVNKTDSFTDEHLMDWDTTKVSDGVYMIKLEAEDAAGNKGEKSITITLNNTPDNKDQCKDDGWKNFYVPKFKNQGDCVSFIESSSKAKDNKTK